MPEVRTGRELGGQFIAGDPLRGLGALWVVVYHVASNSLARTKSEGITVDMSAQLGQFGHVTSRALFAVFLFFGLSGYLLARPFLHSILLDTRWPDVRRFLRNRALRIVPVFWLACLAAFIIFGRRGEGWSEVLVVPLFAQIWDPSHFSAALPQAWTLDNEVLFYLSLPLLAWAGAKALRGRGTAEQRAFAVLGFLLVTAALSIVYRDAQTEWQGLISPPAVWFAFAAGIAVAAIEPMLRDRIATPEAGRPWATALLAVGVAALAFWIWGPDSLWQNAVAAFVSTFALILAPLLLQWTTGSCWRAFDNRPLHWVGHRSYSFYLWHGLVLYGLSKPLPEYPDRPWLTVIVLLVPTLVVGLIVTAISFSYIEQPFLRRKHIWRRGEAAKPGTEQAGAPVRVGT